MGPACVPMPCTPRESSDQTFCKETFDIAPREEKQDNPKQLSDGSVQQDWTERMKYSQEESALVIGENRNSMWNYKKNQTYSALPQKQMIIRDTNRQVSIPQTLSMRQIGIVSQENETVKGHQNVHFLGQSFKPHPSLWPSEKGMHKLTKVKDVKKRKALFRKDNKSKYKQKKEEKLKREKYGYKTLHLQESDNNQREIDKEEKWKMDVEKACVHGEENETSEKERFYILTKEGHETEKQDREVSEKELTKNGNSIRTDIASVMEGESVSVRSQITDKLCDDSGKKVTYPQKGRQGDGVLHQNENTIKAQSLTEIAVSAKRNDTKRIDCNNIKPKKDSKNEEIQIYRATPFMSLNDSINKERAQSLVNDKAEKEVLICSIRLEKCGSVEMDLILEKGMIDSRSKRKEPQQIEKKVLNEDFKDVYERNKIISEKEKSEIFNKNKLISEKNTSDGVYKRREDSSQPKNCKSLPNVDLEEEHDGLVCEKAEQELNEKEKKQKPKDVSHGYNKVLANAHRGKGRKGNVQCPKPTTLVHKTLRRRAQKTLKHSHRKKRNWYRKRQYRFNKRNPENRHRNFKHIHSHTRPGIGGNSSDMKQSKISCPTCSSNDNKDGQNQEMTSVGLQKCPLSGAGPAFYGPGGLNSSWFPTYAGRQCPCSGSPPLGNSSPKISGRGDGQQNQGTGGRDQQNGQGDNGRNSEQNSQNPNQNDAGGDDVDGDDNGNTSRGTQVKTKKTTGQQTSGLSPDDLPQQNPPGAQQGESCGEGARVKKRPHICNTKKKGNRDYIHFYQVLQKKRTGRVSREQVDEACAKLDECLVKCLHQAQDTECLTCAVHYTSLKHVGKCNVPFWRNCRQCCPVADLLKYHNKKCLLKAQSAASPERGIKEDMLCQENLALCHNLAKKTLDRQSQDLEHGVQEVWYTPGVWVRIKVYLRNLFDITLAMDPSPETFTKDQGDYMVSVPNFRSVMITSMNDFQASMVSSIVHQQVVAAGGMEEQITGPLDYSPINEMETSAYISDLVKYGKREDLVAVGKNWYELKTARSRPGYRIDLAHDANEMEEGIILLQFKMNLKVAYPGGRYQKGQQWETGPVLGAGMSGRCSLAMDTHTGFKFCVKEMMLDKFEFTEMGILTTLYHPSICVCYGAVRMGDTVYVMMEYIEGCSLHDHICSHQRLNDLTAMVYLKQLIEVLQYLREHCILHEDIKSENILLKSGTTKLVLIDFGLARHLPSEDPKVPRNERPVGSQTQWSPEKAMCQGYSYEADMWAVGCVLLEMISGSPPWVKRYAQASNLIYVISMNSPPLADIPEYVSTTLRRLIIWLWTMVPAERPSPATVLNHAAFSIIASDKVKTVLNNRRILFSGSRHTTEAPSDSTEGPNHTMSFDVPVIGTQASSIEQSGHANSSCGEYLQSPSPLLSDIQAKTMSTLRNPSTGFAGHPSSEAQPCSSSSEKGCFQSIAFSASDIDPDAKLCPHQDQNNPHLGFPGFQDVDSQTYTNCGYTLTSGTEEYAQASASGGYTQTAGSLCYKNASANLGSTEEFTSRGFTQKYTSGGYAQASADGLYTQTPLSTGYTQASGSGGLPNLSIFHKQPESIHSSGSSVDLEKLMNEALGNNNSSSDQDEIDDVQISCNSQETSYTILTNRGSSCQPATSTAGHAGKSQSDSDIQSDFQELQNELLKRTNSEHLSFLDDDDQCSEPEEQNVRREASQDLLPQIGDQQLENEDFGGTLFVFLDGVNKMELTQVRVYHDVDWMEVVLTASPKIQMKYKGGYCVRLPGADTTLDLQSPICNNGPHIVLEVWNYTGQEHLAEEEEWYVKDHKIEYSQYYPGIFMPQ